MVLLSRHTIEYGFFASELFIIERQQESYVRRLSGSFTHTASDATVAGQRHEWSQLFV